MCDEKSKSCPRNGWICASTPKIRSESWRTSIWWVFKESSCHKTLTWLLCDLLANQNVFLSKKKQKMNSLQKQIEDAGLRLHNAELNKSKFVPINEITSEKIAAHLAELKVRSF